MFESDGHIFVRGLKGPFTPQEWTNLEESNFGVFVKKFKQLYHENAFVEPPALKDAAEKLMGRVIDVPPPIEIRSICLERCHREIFTH